MLGVNKQSKAGMPPTNAANWTEAEDQALQDGLQRYPHTLDKNARWTSIAAGVPARSKRECVARFREIRAALMATTAGGGSGRLSLSSAKKRKSRK